ncbi:MAG: ammonium transporter [Polyangiaceae bacterium]|nr:ammonium transporter [Polyangiaceae bacterium]
MRNRIGLALVALAVALSAASWSQAAFADEPAPAPAAEAPAEAKKNMTFEEFQEKSGIKDDESLENSPLGSAGGGTPVNHLWTMVAAILVFWMQAGFALVESGFTRAKNAVNIFMKNFMDFSLGSIIFWALGFGLMFGVSNGFFGTTGFMLKGYDNETWSFTFLMFQTVFAATAATIVSGAMAERTKFTSYLIYSVFITAIIYPIFGSWAWGGLFKGGGWLEAPEGGFLASKGLPGFIDYAGSTVVHSIGGWAALAGAIVLGPRIGKYDSKGRPLPIRGHNMALATVGVFILWMGWFGFNAGSTTAVTGGGADPFGGSGKAFALIAVNTNLAACAGAVMAMIVVWGMTKKPDIGMTLNGALAGLVSITAPCANVSPMSAVVIGAIGGALVVFAVQFFDRIKVDDPVGAVSVHGVCGAWGTLSAAIFNHGGFTGAQLATQAIGVLAAFVWSFGLAFILFKVIKATVGLRVTAEEEIEGLDITEHGNEAYPRELGGGHGIDPDVAEAAGLKAAETAEA